MNQLLVKSAPVGGLTPGAWSALAEWATFLVAVVAAWIAIVQLLRARQLSEEQATAYVIVGLESSEIGFDQLELVIRNIGATPAFDVRISIDPPMIRAHEVSAYPFMGANVLSETIRMIAPGQEIRLWFDSAGKTARANLDNVFEARVTGTNYRGRSLRPAAFVLDANWGEGALYPERHNLHWFGFRVKNMEKSLEEIAKLMKSDRQRKP